MQTDHDAETDDYTDTETDADEEAAERAFERFSRRGVLGGLAALGLAGLASQPASAIGPTLEFGGNYTGDPGSNFGLSLAPTNARFGFLGFSDTTDGRGVVGRATSSTGRTIGVIGRSDSSTDGAAGLMGFCDAPTGVTYGFRGRSDSAEGTGALGIATATSGDTIGLEGRVNSPDGYGLFTPDDAKVGGSLQFTGGSEPHAFMFESGTSNPDQNVIAHSPGFPDWGLRYDDVGDRFVFQSGGVDDVRIGLAGAPNLHVFGSVAQNASGPSGHVAAIENRSTSTNGDVLFLGTDVSNATTSNNFISFFDGGGGVGAIEGNGSGGVNYKSGAADIAEYFPAADPDAVFEAGDVVGLAGGEIVSDPTEGDRALVVSDAPMLTGNVPEDEEADGDVCAALLGQVPVRIGEAVEAGTLLVATADGTAVPADSDRAGADAPVVGRALDAADRSDDAVDAFVVSEDRIERESARERTLERRLTKKAERIDELEAETDALREENAALYERLTAIEAHIGLDAEEAAPAGAAD
jgi:hypothetical protein